MTMTDTDRNDPAQGIEITASLLVPDILHLSFDDRQGLLVIEKNPRI